eukprot:941140-Prymnesium_polylepis.1
MPPDADRSPKRRPGPLRASQHAARRRTHLPRAMPCHAASLGGPPSVGFTNAFALLITDAETQP